MSCIKRTGERFGSLTIIDVLRGSRSKKISALGFDKLSTFGIMKEYPKDTLKELISFLAADGYIVLTGDKYPVLKLNKIAYEVLQGKKNVIIKRAIKKQPQVSYEETAENTGLYGRLKEVRKRIADEENVAPFVIFSNATLHDICRKIPVNEPQMLSVSGVGNYKLERYGEEFISAIKEYITQNHIEKKEMAYAVQNETQPKKEKKTRYPGRNIETISKWAFYTGNRFKTGVCDIHDRRAFA